VDVGTEWVNTFSGTCAQNQLSFCDETSEGFAAAMAAAGHRIVYDRGDGSAVERDFRDETTASDGTGSIDGVDIAYFSSHGSSSDDHQFRGYLGASEDACFWISRQASLGENALKFLCLDTCESIEPAADPIATWGTAFQGLHLLLGFTGLLSDSPWTSSRGDRFASCICAGDPIAVAWLDECQQHWLGDRPVAMAAGRTSDEAERRLDGERLDSASDSIPNDQITAFMWKWRT
jgi:Family of unknown function (DUF6345)